MKSKIFLFVNISGMFFFLAAGLRLVANILGANPEKYFSSLTEAAESAYYLNIVSDVSLLIGGISLIIAGSHYNNNE